MQQTELSSERHPAGFILYTVLVLTLVVSASILRQVFTSTAFRQASKDIPALRGVIIDPGHGGYDGGAVSITGTAEKKLNLMIGNKMSSLAKALGYRVVMTREEDIELTAPERGGSRKMQDIIGRLMVTEKYPSLPLISVHMNRYPQSSCQGLQIWYGSKNQASAGYADAIENEVKTLLQQNNHRKSKEATSAIYLLYHCPSPAVLVECGFLSNREDAEHMEDEAYQKKLTIAILSGFIAQDSERLAQSS